MVCHLLDLVLVEKALSFRFQFAGIVVTDVAVQVSHAALLLHVLGVVEAVLAQSYQVLLHFVAWVVHVV